MPHTKRKRSSDEQISNLELPLEKARTEITKINNELQNLERLLNIKIQNQMNSAALNLPAAAMIEDVFILESAIRANIQINDPSFKEIPQLERRLYQFNRLATLLENRIKQETSSQHQREKESGLMKLDKLCQKYQDYIFVKLGGMPGDTLKRAYLNALKIPHLKDKAKNYFDSFTMLEDLRTILSVHPAYHINKHFPATERRREFEKLLAANEGFFSLRSKDPRVFKDDGEGKKFLQDAKKILGATLEKPKKPRLG